MLLFAAQFDFKVFYAPFPCGFVGVEEYIETVSTNDAAPVEDFNGLAIIVAWHNDFCAERIHFVGGDEDVVALYLVAVSGFTVGKFSAAYFARTVCGDSHCYRFPLAGGFGDCG